MNTDIPPKLHDEFAGGLLRIEHDFAAATLTSLTSLEYFRRTQHDDSDSSPIVSASTSYASRMHQFNQELRLAGDFSDSWRYLAGAFYEHDDLAAFDGSNLSESHFLLGIGAIPPFAPYLFTDFSQDVDSIAAFARLEFDVSDAATIEGGLRYTHDRIDYRGLTARGGNPPRER